MKTHRGMKAGAFVVVALFIATATVNAETNDDILIEEGESYFHLVGTSSVDRPGIEMELEMWNADDPGWNFDYPPKEYWGYTIAWRFPVNYWRMELRGAGWVACYWFNNESHYGLWRARVYLDTSDGWYKGTADYEAWWDGPSGPFLNGRSQLYRTHVSLVIDDPTIEVYRAHVVASYTIDDLGTAYWDKWYDQFVVEKMEESDEVTVNIGQDYINIDQEIASVSLTELGQPSSVACEEAISDMESSYA